MTLTQPRTTVGAEPRHPPTRALNAIDTAARNIRQAETQTSTLSDWFDGYHRNHRARLAFDLDQVWQELHRRAARASASDAAEPAKVLEMGSVPLLLSVALTDQHRSDSPATSLPAATEPPLELATVDVAPERFEASATQFGLQVLKCDIEREPLPFSDHTFDLVIMNELFEHLRIQPIFTLEEVLRVLKPGGRLLVSTPNLRSLRGMRNLIFHNQAHASSAGIYQQYDKLRTLGHYGHVREYTTREVTEFLEQIGFTPRRLIFRGGHGRGVAGLAERLFPSLRPFFSVVASAEGAPRPPADSTP